ncbi:hypothetical protein Tco_0200396 [Tanacetum coccineum]
MIQECKMQEVRALDASSGNIESGRIVSDKWSAKSLENDCSETKDLIKAQGMKIHLGLTSKPMAEVPNYAYYNVFAVKKQHTEQPKFINDTYAIEKNDTNITSDSSDMSHNVRKVDQHAAKHGNECVLLASSIKKLKADIEANKDIQKDLKKVNTSLIQEL